nr:hypothetical protein [uncultured Methanolobus sp.]
MISDRDIKKDSKKVLRDLVLVFGAILTSTGLTQFLPDMQPAYMVLGGILVTYGATKLK